MFIRLNLMLVYGALVSVCVFSVTGRLFPRPRAASVTLTGSSPKLGQLTVHVLTLRPLDPPSSRLGQGQRRASSATTELEY